MLMMDPVVQTEFNAFKGALPARLDANIADLKVKEAKKRAGGIGKRGG